MAARLMVSAGRLVLAWCFAGVAGVTDGWEPVIEVENISKAIREMLAVDGLDFGRSAGIVTRLSRARTGPVSQHGWDDRRNSEAQRRRVGSAAPDYRSGVGPDGEMG